MTTNQPIDSYDEIKGLLNKIRKIQQLAKANTYGLLREQTYQGETANDEDPKNPIGVDKAEIPPKYHPTDPNIQVNPESSEKYLSDEGNDIPQEQSGEGEDLAVINNVEVEIHSEDPEDLQLSDEEKGKISQLIDDFRVEVSEIAEFGKLNIYPDSAKLDGKIGDTGVVFTLSTGDDTGLYLSNSSLLKIDDDSLIIITKLRAFEAKFSAAINDLLVSRSTT
jgi:hypothetical protein